MSTVLTAPSPPVASAAAPPAALRRATPWLAAVVALAAVAAAGLAMRRTSTTFDEITFIAVGARGYETGDFSIIPEHPPLMQYVYGLVPWLAGTELPDESGFEGVNKRQMGYRYLYAQLHFFGGANDPERLALLGRAPALAFVALLVLLTFTFTARHWGPGAGLLAAVLVGFLPDVLAHGGVAYSDLPLAVLMLVTLWSADAAARRPQPARAALAAMLFVLAVGVKFSAIAIAPAVLLLVVAEAVHRRDDALWRRSLARALPAAVLAGYLALVVIYRGDVTLADFRYGLDYTLRHVSDGHGVPAYLLGRLDPDGWWYFFPLAFLFKTPAALHALMLIAALGFLSGPARPLRDHLTSPLRVPLAGILVFGPALLGASLTIGFRYALPLLPLVCIITAAGVASAWRRGGRVLRATVPVLAVWFAASSLAYYPWFLSYTSEYAPGRDREHEVLLDSSVDWGQGLLELRDWMRGAGVERVYLSYFGSAWPAGYGIGYAPVQSFFGLPPAHPAEPEPRHLVISATNLHGVYLPDDPFAGFRELRPDTVLARTLFVYELR